MEGGKAVRLRWLTVNSFDSSRVVPAWFQQLCVIQEANEYLITSQTVPDCLEHTVVSLWAGCPSLAKWQASCASGLPWPKASFRWGMHPKVGVVEWTVPALWQHLPGS